MKRLALMLVIIVCMLPISPARAETATPTPPPTGTACVRGYSTSMYDPYTASFRYLTNFSTASEPFTGLVDLAGTSYYYPVGISYYSTTLELTGAYVNAYNVGYVFFYDQFGQYIDRAYGGGDVPAGVWIVAAEFGSSDGYIDLCLPNAITPTPTPTSTPTITPTQPTPTPNPNVPVNCVERTPTTNQPATVNMARSFTIQLMSGGVVALTPVMMGFIVLPSYPSLWRNLSSYEGTVTLTGNGVVRVCEGYGGSVTATRTPTGTPLFSSPTRTPTMPRTPTNTKTPPPPGTPSDTPLPTETAFPSPPAGCVNNFYEAGGSYDEDFGAYGAYISSKNADILISIVEHEETIFPNAGTIWRWSNWATIRVLRIADTSALAMVTICPLDTPPQATSTQLPTDTPWGGGMPTMGTMVPCEVCIIITPITPQSTVTSVAGLDMGLDLPTLLPGATVTVTVVISATSIIAVVRTVSADMATPMGVVATLGAGYTWQSGQATAAAWSTPIAPAIGWLGVVNPNNPAWTTEGGPLWAIYPLIWPVLPIVGGLLLAVLAAFILWVAGLILKIVDIVINFIKLIPFV